MREQAAFAVNDSLKLVSGLRVPSFDPSTLLRSRRRPAEEQRGAEYSLPEKATTSAEKLAICLSATSRSVSRAFAPAGLEKDAAIWPNRQLC